ncbi:MAG: thioredoxin family protein [Acidobacteriota bacterium]
MNINVKRLFASVCIIAFGAFATLPLLAQPDSKAKPSARELLSAAVKTGNAESKTILVHFSASWCGWCKRLDAFLQAPDVGKLMTDNYVLLELTVQESREKKALENPGAEALMKEMGGANAGLPFYFFLDKQGKKIGDSLVMPGGKNIGHPANAKEIEAFAGLLERTAPRMTTTQRARIVEYLTQNAPQRS